MVNGERSMLNGCPCLNKVYLFQARTGEILTIHHCQFTLNFISLAIHSWRNRQKVEDFTKNTADKAEDLYDPKDKLSGLFGGDKN